MKERLIWIDQTKGLAILLVVMGHALMWSIGSVHLEENRDVMILFKIIYSFHMPLFMFCSGFLIPKDYSTYNIDNFIKLLKKKAISLLIPFAVSGIIAWIAYREYYWFLFKLFEFICLSYVVCSAVNIIGGGRKSEMLLLLLICAIIWFVTGKNMQNLQNMLVRYYPIIDLGHWRLFLYFSMGILFKRYNLLGYITKDIVYAICLTLFVCFEIICCVYCKFPALQLCLPFFAIITIVGFFYNNQSIANNHRSVLLWLGKNSLKIYILQYFFRTNVPGLRAYYLEYLQVNSLGSLICIQFVVTLLESLAIIAMCYISIRVIETSKILALLVFGKRN